MGRVADNGVIGVLAALHDNIAGKQAAIVFPEPEVGGYVCRIADFLQGEHIGPEGIDIAVLVLFEKLAQGKARVKQQILAFLLSPVAVDLGVVVVAEHIAGHGLYAQAGLAVHVRNPLGHLHKAVLLHVLVDKLYAPACTGHGKQGLILVMPEGSFEILHHHGKARVVMTFLLGNHQPQGQGRGHGLKAFYGTDSTHHSSRREKKSSCGAFSWGMREKGKGSGRVARKAGGAGLTKRARSWRPPSLVTLYGGGAIRRSSAALWPQPCPRACQRP